jgi:hypothetical protein
VYQEARLQDIFSPWGGQFCPQPAFSRLWPPEKAAAAMIGRPLTGQSFLIPGRWRRKAQIKFYTISDKINWKR